MTTYQRIIKSLAIILAMIIILLIMYCIINIINNVFDLSFLYNNENHYEKSFRNLTRIKIDSKTSQINIKSGNKYKIIIDNTNKNYDIKETKKSIEVEEKKLLIKKKKDKTSITIYIPRKKRLNELNIDSDIGIVNIDNVDINILDLEEKAGTININNSNILKTILEGKAGKITINKSYLNNLELETKVSKVDINAYITGISKIKSGISSINISLLGSKNDYQIKSNKKVGSIIINDEEQKNNSLYGYGENYIEVENGIGTVNIEFIK